MTPSYPLGPDTFNTIAHGEAVVKYTLCDNQYVYIKIYGFGCEVRTQINKSGERPENNANIGSVGGHFNKIYVICLPKQAAKCENRNLNIPEGSLRKCEMRKCCLAQRVFCGHRGIILQALRQSQEGFSDKHLEIRIPQ